MNAIRSVFVWSSWILIGLLGGPFALVAILVSPTGAGFRLMRFFVRTAFGLAGIRVVPVGLEHVDWSRPHVMMANHQNLLDHFALLLVVPKHMVGVEKIENLRIPIYGRLTRAWGNISIQREDRTHAHQGIATAADQLRKGHPILIFPEGTRTKDGSLGPFKKGGFHMALDAGVDILPFAVDGGYAILQTGDWHLRPGTITLRFGRPVPTDGTQRDDLEPLMGRVRAAIEGLLEA